MRNNRFIPKLSEDALSKMGIENFNPKLTELEMKYASLRLKESMLTDEERIAPDTYRCECIFLKFFTTPDMEDEFPLIARDFLQHEMQNLPEYNELVFASEDPLEYWPKMIYMNRILNLMMGAVRKGNDYARKLFCYLHKTYYRKRI